MLQTIQILEKLRVATWEANNREGFPVKWEYMGLRSEIQ